MCARTPDQGYSLNEESGHFISDIILPGFLLPLPMSRLERI